MSRRTWFITGTSRGFGREWATAALARGDRVVGTARNATTNDDLLAEYPETFRVLQLDVTDRAASFAAVRAAHEYFGELDIVVNNAGYGHFGAIEEVTEQEARAQIETNLFGALWVTQAALPFLRRRGAGHILQVSSIGGISAFPTVGLYHASKWGLEGFSQALAQEVAGFGIHVTLIEPGGFSTDWAGASAKRSQPIAAYEPVRTAVAAGRAGAAAGDPSASSAAVLRIVDDPQPPLRCFLGARPIHVAEADYASRLETWRKWQPVAELAQSGPATAESARRQPQPTDTAVRDHQAGREAIPTGTGFEDRSDSLADVYVEAVARFDEWQATTGPETAKPPSS